MSQEMRLASKSWKEGKEADSPLAPPERNEVMPQPPPPAGL